MRILRDLNKDQYIDAVEYTNIGYALVSRDRNDKDYENGEILCWGLLAYYICLLDENALVNKVRSDLRVESEIEPETFRSYFKKYFEMRYNKERNKTKDHPLLRSAEESRDDYAKRHLRDETESYMESIHYLQEPHKKYFILFYRGYLDFLRLQFSAYKSLQRVIAFFMIESQHISESGHTPYQMTKPEVRDFCKTGPISHLSISVESDGVYQQLRKDEMKPDIREFNKVSDKLVQKQRYSNSKVKYPEDHEFALVLLQN